MQLVRLRGISGGLRITGGGNQFCLLARPGGLLACLHLHTPYGKMLKSYVPCKQKGEVEALLASYLFFVKKLHFWFICWRLENGVYVCLLPGACMHPQMELSNSLVADVDQLHEPPIYKGNRMSYIHIYACTYTCISTFQ